MSLLKSCVQVLFLSTLFFSININAQVIGDIQHHFNKNDIRLIDIFEDKIIALGPDVYYRLSHDNDFRSDYESNESEYLKNPSSLAIGPDSSLWVGRTGKISIWKQGEWVEIGADILDGKLVEDIFFDSTGTTWIGTWGGGLYKHKNGEWENLNRWDDGLPDNRVLAFAEENKNKIWYGVHIGGIGYIDTAGIHNIELAFNEMPFDIREMRFEHGALWIAAWDGFYKFENDHIEKFYDNQVLSIDFYNEYIFLGTYDEGLLRYNRNTHQITEIKPESIPLFIRDITIIDDHVWIATIDGIIKYAINSGDLIHARTASLKDNRIQDISYDSKGNMWISTYSGGVSLFKDGNWISFDSLTTPGAVVNSVYPLSDSIFFISDSQKLVRVAFNVSTDKIENLVEYPPARLMATNSKGELIFINNGIRIIGTDTTVIDGSTGLYNTTIRDLVVDKYDQIWVSTLGGVSIVKEDTLVNLRIGTELPSGIFTYQLEDDSKGNIYLSYYSLALNKTSIAVLDENYNLVDIDLPGTANYQHFKIDKKDRIWVSSYVKDGNRWISLKELHPEIGDYTNTLNVDSAKGYVSIGTSSNGVFNIDVNSLELPPLSPDVFLEYRYCLEEDSISLQASLNFDYDSVSWKFVHDSATEIEIKEDTLLVFKSIQQGPIGYSIKRNIGSFESKWSDTTEVAFNFTMFKDIDSLLCKGDSVFFIDHYVFEAGIYRDTLSAVSGCDSLVNLTLNFYPEVNFTLGNDTTVLRGESIQISPTPSSFETFEWNGDNSNASSFDFVGEEPGEFSVTLKAYSTDGCFGTDTIVVEVINITGIKDWGRDVNVFPNPVKDDILIVAGAKINKVTINDLSGKNVKTFKPDNTVFAADLNGIDQGVYVVHIESSNGTVIKKIVKE